MKKTLSAPRDTSKLLEASVLNTLTCEEFNYYYFSQKKMVIAAVAEKNFERAETLLLYVIKNYEGLNDEIKIQFKDVPAFCYYDLTCIFSMKEDVNKALEYFKNALDAGYPINIENDNNLNLLRADKRLKAILEKHHKPTFYLATLKRSGKFITEHNLKCDNFKFQSPSSDALIKIRKDYDLDSIAGQGNEISKIKNVLNWIHCTLKHNGYNYYKGQRNAFDIISYCRNEKQGVNCRMIAIASNECFLAMGFKSRFVTCLPQNQDDTECHVINMVFSNTLNKWLWLDPTSNAYLYDENGIMLGIGEVREKLIRGESLMLNVDANLNGNHQTKEDYLYNYMTKNLYWFQCPLSSEFNLESNVHGKQLEYVNLLPQGYNRNNNLSNQYVKYINTNDAEYFFQKPV